MTRTQIIKALIDKFELKSFLEIGVFKGTNFDKIRCEVRQSVDPGHPATFEMASDEFFNRHAEGRYDIIFIDGLHTSEQVYKDISNALTFLDRYGFIVVHDCNPETEWATRPPEQYKQGEVWNGDVYKGFIRFKAEHPELSFFTIDTDYGCGVITHRDLIENNSISVISLTWEFFENNSNDLLQLISVEVFIGFIK